MNRILPIKEARARLTSLPEDLADDNEPLMVTRNGKPALAIMTWDLWESYQETMDIMSDPEAMTQIRKAIAEVEAGHVVPWEEAKRQLRRSAATPARVRHQARVR